MIVMHPGPINRGREISSEVADSQRSVILNQVENGIAVRMAVLERVLDVETAMPALLIKNGRVIDPASGRDGVADVWIEDGVIRGVGANLAPARRGSVRCDRTDRRARLHRHARASARARVRARRDDRERRRARPRRADSRPSARCRIRRR